MNIADKKCHKWVTTQFSCRSQSITHLHTVWNSHSFMHASWICSTLTHYTLHRASCLFVSTREMPLSNKVTKAKLLPYKRSIPPTHNPSGEISAQFLYTGSIDHDWAMVTACLHMSSHTHKINKCTLHWSKTIRSPSLPLLSGQCSVLW